MFFQYSYEFQESLSQSVCPYEDNDCRSILSRALDVREYSGRVRGKGFGITPKSLKMKTQKTPSNKELQETLEALQAEVRELRKEKARQYQSEREALGVKETSDIASVNCAAQPSIPEVLTYIIMKLN